MTDLPDDALVSRVLAGDAAAYEALVRRHRRPAYAVALACVGDAAAAEDVLQDAFAHAYFQLATCRTPARFGAWVLQIVRHRALNHRRATLRRRTDPLDEAVPAAGGASPERAAELGELRRHLLTALARIPRVQREVVLLAELEGWAHAEIARALGISTLMSRRHLSDARRRLRELLGALVG